jgi:hypothetical protein
MKTKARGAALESCQGYSLTIAFLHEFFALSISHLFNAPVQNSRGDHQEGDKPNGAASNKFMPDRSSAALLQPLLE